MRRAVGTGYIARFLILAAVLVCLSACQPTPEEPVIVNKNDGKLEEKLQEKQSPDETIKPYEAPAHWSETVKGDKLSIVIDADVDMPAVSKYPVVKLERAAFTQQQIDNMVNYFAAGKKLYLPHVKTKADYDAEIVEAKRGQEIDYEYVVTEESEAWVKELEEKRASAPDESPKIYTDTALTYSRDYETGKEDTSRGKNFLSVMVESSNGEDARISVGNFAEGYTSGTWFNYSSNEEVYYYPEEWHLADLRDIEGSSIAAYKEDMTKEFHIAEYEDLFANMTLNREDAQATAEKAVSDLGIKDLSLVKADKSVCLEYPDKGGYIFEYMRQSGGVNGFSITSGGWSDGEEPPQYSPPFVLETLSILVTEDGIQRFSWNDMSKVVETVSENVELLPFEKIQEALKDQIRYKKSFFDADEYGMKDYTVKVVSAQLRMGYINVKDDPGHALMVPVWVFNTKESYLLDLTGNQFEHDSDQYVLNAIDGGVIEMARPEEIDLPEEEN